MSDDYEPLEQPDLERAIRIFEKLHDPIAIEDHAEFLRIIGATQSHKPISIANFAYLGPDMHVNPIMLGYWSNGQINNSYVDSWREHTLSCSRCASLYQQYEVPLDMPE